MFDVQSRALRRTRGDARACGSRSCTPALAARSGGTLRRRACVSTRHDQQGQQAGACGGVPEREEQHQSMVRARRQSIAVNRSRCMDSASGTV
jgi:hypothetical protein